MNALDPATLATLDRLVPRDVTPPAWGDVLGRARVRRRRHLPWRAGAIAVAAALAAAVVSLSPWEHAGRATVVDRAVAAVGTKPVLHAVIRDEGQKNERLVELATGKVQVPSRVVETEIWYDRAAARGHTIVRTGGTVVDDTLQTPDGTVNMDGVVYTCAWIAAHPVEATKEHVSCHLNGDNGTTPRKIPEAPPAVDPALAAFLTGYRVALESGEARQVGSGVVDGRHVHWLELHPAPPGPIPGSEVPPGAAPPPVVERVAVDAETYKPLLVRSRQGQSAREYRVLTIETVTRADANFATPLRRPAADEVAIGEVIDERDVTVEAAAAALGRSPLWLGREFAGLPLAAIRLQTLRTGYARSTGLPPRTSRAVEIVYGTLENGHPTEAAAVVDEAAQPEFAYGWEPGAAPPPAGFARVLGRGFGAYLVDAGLYVRIRAPEPLLLPAARALSTAR